MSKNAVRFYFIITDFIAALAAWLGFYIWRRFVLSEIHDGPFFNLLYPALIIATFWVLLYLFFGFYTEVLRQSRIREIVSLLKLSIIGIVLLIFAIITDVLFFSPEEIREYAHLYRNVAAYFFIHFVITALFKLAVMTYSKSLIRRKKIWYNTLLIGSGPAAVEIYEETEKYNGHLGLRFCGYVDTGNGANQVASIMPSLGSYTQLEQIIKNQKIEQAIIAIEHHESDKLEAILNYAEGFGVRLSIMPDMYQILIGSVKVNHIFGTPLIEIKTDLMPLWQQVCKRIFDITVALLVLTLGSVFYLAIAILTKMSSPGPVFYRQERIGLGGKPFKIIKFRSMYVDAEKQGPRLSSTHDPRITPWGLIMRRTRLDEFPQFFNVLVGDMSLVGPRPERQYFIDQIVKVAPHYKHLNRVRPGITSLGQVKFGYAENVEQMVRRLRYDIIYIENMSLGMDLKIIAYTVLTMLKGSGK